MCVITVSLALCETNCPYHDADVPAGCLKIYPFTSVEIHCPDSGCVLGSCGNVEMFKDEGQDGSRIDKRICESCVAWSALMRNRHSKKSREQKLGKNVQPQRRQEQEELDSDGQEVMMTPVESSESSEVELDTNNEVLERRAAVRANYTDETVGLLKTHTVS
ncbi:hypothetical protein VP1G_02635 [Cytospora mali]|uniref:Uncharacterized protein n=1 Tax=Cytospora mali TaxID=578113 RepID=A0A194UUG2_CYTMA|nr:hypothetical protein VP1G_02635 [Valsa mali var. pyri (nom. inval.)]